MAGQSGSPVYVFQGGRRRIVGVLLGSPLSACQQGQDWVSRITPETAERIGIDFSWTWKSCPGPKVRPTCRLQTAAVSRELLTYIIRWRMRWACSGLSPSDWRASGPFSRTGSFCPRERASRARNSPV